MSTYKLLIIEEAKAEAARFNFNPRTLTYVLWDNTQRELELPARPLYVGTAEGPSRIIGHARKDRGNAPRDRTHRNPGLSAHVEAAFKKHGEGWLRFTLRQHATLDAAKADEQVLIGEWGIVSQGGLLFNRRLGG